MMLLRRNGAPKSAEPQKPADPYKMAQVSVLSYGDRATKEASAWRKIALGASALVGLAMLALIWMATHPSRDVVVYRDSGGKLAYEGRALQNPSPTDENIAQQLVLYVEALRSVPGVDSLRAQQNADLVGLMTVDQSPNRVHSDVVSFLHDNNPKEIAKDGTVRDVLSVIPTHIPNTQTWLLTWAEQTSRPQQKPSQRVKQASVVVAPAKFGASDDAVRLDPSGTIVIEQHGLI